MKELNAVTLAEFKQHCEALAADYPDLRLYFRGQVHNHPPTPSELRPSTEAADRIREHYRRGLWMNAVMAAVYEPGSSPGVDEIAASCLLQHYGFRSWFIDVTSDPNIALWFATRRYTVENKLFYVPAHRAGEKHVDHPFGAINTLQLPIAHYVAAQPGHIYVYAVDPSNKSFVDLQEHAPASAVRVRRQQGAGLFPTSARDYRGLQVAHIDLAPAVADEVADLRSAAGELLTTEHLFPGPGEDSMYKLLLRLPRIAAEDDESADLRVAVDAFDVPLYESRSMTEYIPALLSRAVAGTTRWCLTCLGHTEATVELPITRPGGAPREIFKPAHLQNTDAGDLDSGDTHSGEVHDLAERALVRAIGPSASAPSPGLSGWPAKRLFLRIHVLRDVWSFLMNSDPYPLVRGYILEAQPEGTLTFRLVQELDNGAIGIYPSPSDPGFDVNRAPGYELAATLGEHDCSGGTADKMCDYCEQVLIALHTPWIHAYLEGVSTGEAFLHRNSPHHYALYWADADGAEPLGEPWAPTVPRKHSAGSADEG
jgi:hypothetical protein